MATAKSTLSKYGSILGHEGGIVTLKLKKGIFSDAYKAKKKKAAPKKKTAVKKVAAKKKAVSRIKTVKVKADRVAYIDYALYYKQLNKTTKGVKKEKQFYSALNNGTGVKIGKYKFVLIK